MLEQVMKPNKKEFKHTRKVAVAAVISLFLLASNAKPAQAFIDDVVDVVEEVSAAIQQATGFLGGTLANFLGNISPEVVKAFSNFVEEWGTYIQDFLNMGKMGLEFLKGDLFKTVGSIVGQALGVVAEDFLDDKTPKALGLPTPSTLSEKLKDKIFDATYPSVNPDKGREFEDINDKMEDAYAKGTAEAFFTGEKGQERIKKIFDQDKEIVDSNTKLLEKSADLTKNMKEANSTQDVIKGVGEQLGVLATEEGQITNLLAGIRNEAQISALAQQAEVPAMIQSNKHLRGIAKEKEYEQLGKSTGVWSSSSMFNSSISAFSPLSESSDTAPE